MRSTYQVSKSDTAAEDGSPSQLILLDVERECEDRKCVLTGVLVCLLYCKSIHVYITVSLSMRMIKWLTAGGNGKQRVTVIRTKRWWRLRMKGGGGTNECQRTSYKSKV